MKKLYDAIILVFFLAVIVTMFVLQSSKLELCIAIIATIIFAISVLVTAVQKKQRGHGLPCFFSFALKAESEGFEPSCPGGLTHFECAPL